MTQALDAMVRAMREEFYRQWSADQDARPDAMDGLVICFVEARGEPGHFDMEKVARAGLEAIKEPRQELQDTVLLAVGDACDVNKDCEVVIRADAGRTVIRAMVDKILETKP